MQGLTRLGVSSDLSKFGKHHRLPRESEDCDRYTKASPASTGSKSIERADLAKEYCVTRMGSITL
jgi:hypothetical protein